MLDDTPPGKDDRDWDRTPQSVRQYVQDQRRQIEELHSLIDSLRRDQKNTPVSQQGISPKRKFKVRVPQVSFRQLLTSTRFFHVLAVILPFSGLILAVLYVSVYCPDSSCGGPTPTPKATSVITQILPTPTDLVITSTPIPIATDTSLPEPTAVVATATSIPNEQPTAGSTITPSMGPCGCEICYTVLPADDLSTIASKYGITIEEIRLANPGKIIDVDKIFAGTVFCMPKKR